MAATPQPVADERAAEAAIAVVAEAAARHGLRRGPEAPRLANAAGSVFKVRLLYICGKFIDREAQFLLREGGFGFSEVATETRSWSGSN
jgi:hypothetical protein